MCRQITQYLTIPMTFADLDPGSPILTVHSDEGQLTQDEIFWGLTLTDRAGSAKLIYNARAETVSQKPTFRTAMTRRRLAVPVDSFLEFPRNMAPVRFRRRTGNRMLLAGLWQPRQDHNGCVIITQMANSVVRPHHPRMPALIAEQHLGDWLSPDTEPARLRQLLQPTEWTTVDAEPQTAMAASALR